MFAILASTLNLLPDAAPHCVYFSRNDTPRT